MIPHIIHQIWLGDRPPPTYLMHTWQEKHPGWEYHLWTDRNRPLLTAEANYQRIKSYTMKSDILRYELLYRYGGIYADCDTWCLKPLDHLMEEELALIEDQYWYRLRGWMWNGLMLARPGHPLMGLLCVYLKHVYIRDPHAHGMMITGPKKVTEFLKQGNYPYRHLSCLEYAQPPQDLSLAYVIHCQDDLAKRILTR